MRYWLFKPPQPTMQNSFDFWYNTPFGLSPHETVNLCCNSEKTKHTFTFTPKSLIYKATTTMKLAALNLPANGCSIICRLFNRSSLMDTPNMPFKYPVHSLRL